MIVIMAGGRGLRLHPLTEKTPKPLLKIGAKPMLECILDGFVEQGFDQFTFSVGYKASLVREHFGDGRKWGVDIHYVEESAPLGTAGALSLIEPQECIVANADVLAHIDYQDLLNRHRASGHLGTMCLSLHQYQVPYGVCYVRDAAVTKVLEKPIKSWPVAAGVYALSRGAFDYIGDGPIDMPDLLERLPSVGAYEVEGFWVDVGTFKALGEAQGLAG